MSNRLDPYWMMLAHADGLTNQRKMEFLIACVHGKMPLDEALQQVKAGNTPDFEFTDTELEGLLAALDSLPNYAFLSERLIASGVDCINVMDRHHYPETLKKNLRKNAPVIIYAKGNLALLQRSCVAVVGARKSSEAALAFTEVMVKKAGAQRQVVVSGLAKGVDQKALDTALSFYGQSIIVLPQGIETFNTKAYYPKIVTGNVLVISTFHPKLSSSIALAKHRDKTIHALADEIHAAESNDSGETWEGMMDRLKQGRKVYVRLPEKGEENAHQQLIGLGATAVDINGDVVATDPTAHQATAEALSKSPTGHATGPTTAEEVILAVEKLLNHQEGRSLSTTDISLQLNLSDSWKKRLGGVLNRSPKFTGKKIGREKVYSIAVTQSS